MHRSTDYHPKHDRTSCDDTMPVNADAEGSTGCARCTAILLDHRAAMVERLLHIANRMRTRLILRALIRNDEWQAIADELATLAQLPNPIPGPEKDEDA